METAPSEAFEGAAEEVVEVDIGEKEIVGYLDAPNKDTNTGTPIDLITKCFSRLEIVNKKAYS